MSQSEHSCKAVLEQGSNKGKQCDRPILEYGYCGKHQKQAEIKNAIKDGKRKCSRHRCTETFIPITTKEIEYCDTCKKAKEDLQASLIICKWNDNECKKPAKASGFCGKHESRGILLETSIQSGIRICDDGKRACKNPTTDKKLRCDECLEKDRKKDNIRYNEKKDNLNMCLGCGTEITELLDGKRNKVQRCAECYAKLKVVEENRGPRNRNYLEEKKANLEKYLLSYIQCAKTRNIAFELTKEQFEQIVITACYYCGSYNDKEVIGIDRLNSSRKYTLENCVPCCKTCNFMKGTLSKNAFITQAHKIAIQHRIEEMSESEEEDIIMSSTIPPSKVAELYRNGKFGIFIEQCIKDKRSPLFIEKLKGIQGNKMSYNEFKIFFRTCCKTDSKLVSSHLTNERKRISQKELYGYFNNKNSEYAVDIYESIHGVMPGFKEDMTAIAEIWDILTFDERTSSIYTILVKYRNQRTNGTVKSIANELTPSP
jgi:hypothetical protein